MKTKSLINKLKKIGFQPARVSGGALSKSFYINGNTVLSFFDSCGEVSCLKTKPSDNHGDDNPYNSNCYNLYHDTMKGAVDALQTDLHGRYSQ